MYIAPLTQAGKEISLSPTTTSIPVQLVASEGGYHMHWSGDSKTLRWTLGDEYFSVDLNEVFSFAENAPDSLPEPPKTGTEIGLDLPTHIPEGLIAFTNARIITMNGDEVIENGSILVDGNRIKAIGQNIDIPSTATVMDVSGKTIMPGIVDVHAHLGNFRLGVSPQQQWEYMANLAYGVTTPQSFIKYRDGVFPFRSYKSRQYGWPPHLLNRYNSLRC